MPDYSKTVVYQLKCKDKAVHYLYIDSTVSFIKRKSMHKCNSIANKQTELYQTINQNGGWNNWEIIILENCKNCTSSQQSNEYVNKWYKLLKINKNDSNENSYEHTTTTTSNANAFICENCKKTFTRKDNMKKHYNRCKIMKLNLKTNEEIIQKKDFEKFKQDMMIQFEKLLNEKCKMHPKTLNKINNNLQNNNNCHNKTINYNIVELGKENLSELFTIEQQKKILKHRYKCIDYLVETVHFNTKSENFRMFQNVAITNIHDTFAYKYMEKEDKFIIVNKNDLLKDLMTYRIEDIREFFDNCQEEGLDDVTIKAVRKFLDDMDNDDKKLNDKTRDIRLIIFNKRDIVQPILLV